MAKAKRIKKKTGGPFLAVAVFCENILEDNRRIMSAIGIADGCTIQIPENAPKDVPSKTHPVPVAQNILLSFRTGDAPGKHQLKLMVEQPDGKRTKVMDREIELSPAPNGGLNVRTAAQLLVFSSGVFWFDVYLDGKRYTRMPYNIKFVRQDQASAKSDSVEAT